MKFNFKKISAIAASALLTGMTMGVAAAASYPNPFVVNGAADVAIVYGTGAGVSDLDQIQAYNVNLDLQTYISTTTTTTDVENAASLASGSDLNYLNDDLGENVQTVTYTSLPNVLASGTFTDDDGTDYNYNQKITVGTGGSNDFALGNSGGELDDPALMLELYYGSAVAANYAYQWEVTFTKAVNFTSSSSEGEEINIFGKTYTVSSATDDNTLVLLGGASDTTINADETVTLVVGEKSYDVTLTGLSSATTTQAGISVVYNGETKTKTYTQGQTKTFVFSDGTEVDLYAKTVFRTGDTGTGYVNVQVGADKLTLETASEVKKGSDSDDVDGTLVTFTPDTTSGAASSGQAMTKIQVAISAPESTDNYVIPGGSFLDPVFGTVELTMPSIVNGPEFTGEEDTASARHKISLSSNNRRITLELTDKNGNTKASVPFVRHGMLNGDDAGDVIHIIEGENISAVGEYVILNSGDEEHFLELTKLNVAGQSLGESDVVLEDVITGEKIGGVNGFQNQNFYDGYSASIGGQTYTITNTTGGGITIVSSDYDADSSTASATYASNAKVSIFPYIELVSGEDYPRVALIGNMTRTAVGGPTITTTSNNTANYSRVYELPTGTIQFRINDTNVWNAGGTTQTLLDYRVDGSSGWTNFNTSVTTKDEGDSLKYTFAVNEGTYVFDFTLDGTTALATNASLAVHSISYDLDKTAGIAGNDEHLHYPILLLVEDKDKSDVDARNVVILNTTDDGTYSEFKNVILSHDTEDTNYNSEIWDDEKLTGYLTNWGTYVLKDLSDTNQYTARLTYPDAHMYANIYLAELGANVNVASVSGGSLGNIVYKDSETGSYNTKNVIVIGGSCINSAAAALVGGAHCTTDWTDATGVGSGEFLIKGYTGSSVTSKIALLVAGYGSADTVNAATYLTNKKPDTGKAWKGTTATAAATEITAA